MKFSSWNVNGLRAVERKKIFPEYVSSGEYDIIFLMETKCEMEQLSDKLTQIPGYSFTLQPSTYKKGYAGVAVYIKDSSFTSHAVATGFSHQTSLHDEERILTVSFTHPLHGSCAVTGAYFPNGARGGSKTANGKDADGNPLENLQYKLDFFTEFLKHIKHLQKHNDHVYVCGDINIAHHEIDLARPESNKKSIGFLPEERAKLDEWISSDIIDVWRHFKQDEIVYSWWDVISRARERNVGWRIDYWWATKNSLDTIYSISYDTDQDGSDHCPVILEI